ncbi:hypothetical protein SAMN05444746_12710 [Variovorax sp. OK212]|nr:hypothetical protein SAMN05518853_12710 [Variovorax sp. OK202]SFE51978.1 hypothetical protein SAMN05444746_12710 [Variovorax sp. OK212]
MTCSRAETLLARQGATATDSVGPQARDGPLRLCLAVVREGVRRPLAHAPQSARVPSVVTVAHARPSNCTCAGVPSVLSRCPVGGHGSRQDLLRGKFIIKMGASWTVPSWSRSPMWPSVTWRSQAPAANKPWACRRSAGVGRLPSAHPGATRRRPDRAVSEGRRTGGWSESNMGGDPHEGTRTDLRHAAIGTRRASRTGPNVHPRALALRFALAGLAVASSMPARPLVGAPSRLR